MLESGAATTDYDTAGNYATGIIVFASVVITLSLLVSMLACRLFAEEDSGSEKEPSESTTQIGRSLSQKARQLVEQTSVRVWVEDRLGRAAPTKRWFRRATDNRGMETLLRVSPEPPDRSQAPTSILRPGSNGKLPCRSKNVTYSAVPTEEGAADDWCKMAIEELSDEIFV
uniref:Transmembrane protein n=1 Tax=Plectus sambesii TaxID=2011161 RepID=A0A914X5A2_9BILA